VSEEPRFLLPETTEKYLEILAGLNLQVEQFRLARVEEVNQLLAKFNELNAVVKAMLRQSANEPAAKAELLRRDAERTRQEAKNIHILISRNEGLAMWAERWYALPPKEWFISYNKSWESLPLVAAERQARSWEQSKILENGETIFSETRLPAQTAEEEDSSEPRSWDRIERRIICFRGMYSLWQFRSKAVVRKTRMVQSSMGSYPARYGYSPTGDYEPQKMGFVTDSVTQMTERELSAIAG